MSESETVQTPHPSPVVGSEVEKAARCLERLGWPSMLQIADLLRSLVAERDEAREWAANAIRSFVSRVLHGDEEHRNWLIDAGEAFIAGDRPMPEPNGRGRAEAAEARADSLQAQLEAARAALTKLAGMNLCEPGCEGRCEACPATIVARALSPAKEEPSP